MLRLREIQNKLSDAQESEKYHLYLEAEHLFTKIGKIKNAKQCKELASKYHMNNKLVNLPLELLVKVGNRLDLMMKLRLKQTCKVLHSKLLSHLFWSNLELSNSISEKQFAHILNLSMGKAKVLHLINAMNIGNKCVKGIQNNPTCLESLQIIDNSSLDSKSILPFLSSKQLKSTLRSVSFSHCRKLDSKCINRILAFMTSLKELKLQYCNNITNDAFDLAAEKLELEVLVLNLAQISFSAIKSLIEKCSGTLVALVLISFKTLGPVSLFNVLSLCNNLRHLQLGSDILQSVHLNSPFSTFTRNCRQLRIFTLTSGSPAIQDSHISAIAQNCSMLQRLEIPSCSNLYGECLQDVARLSDLYTVNFKASSRMDCMQFNNFLLIKGRDLRVINISCNAWVIDLTIEYLAQLPKLEQLGIAKCTAITTNGVAKLLKKDGCRLKVLDIAGNPQLSASLVNALRSALGPKTVLYSN